MVGVKRGRSSRYRHRRLGRSRAAAAGAFVAASGLFAVNALPAWAVGADGGGAVAGFGPGDVQSFAVSGQVRGGGDFAGDDSGWSTGGWTSPVVASRRDGFGPRLVRPVPGVNLMHRGQDLGADCGDRVRAANGGTVVQAGWYGSYGNWVMIDHGNGVRTGYAHAESVSVRVGQRVEAGQPVALAGTTGASSGCHVHFEVRAGGVAVDPAAFFRRLGLVLGQS